MVSSGCSGSSSSSSSSRISSSSSSSGSGSSSSSSSAHTSLFKTTSSKGCHLRPESDRHCSLPSDARTSRKSSHSRVRGVCFARTCVENFRAQQALLNHF